MAQLTYREAVIEAIAQEMRLDPNVVFIGEDVAAAGGVFKATVGLQDEFGLDRVRDTPISEQAILGGIMGAAMTGLRPVAEIMFSDFLAVCWDIVANQIAKTRYMTNGQIAAAPGYSLRQWRRRQIRCATFTKCGKLGDGNTWIEGGRTIHPRRRKGSARGCDQRSRPGTVF